MIVTVSLEVSVVVWLALGAAGACRSMLLYSLGCKRIQVALDSAHSTATTILLKAQEDNQPRPLSWHCFCSIYDALHLFIWCVGDRKCLYDAVSKIELHDAHHPSKTLKADLKC